MKRRLAKLRILSHPGRAARAGRRRLLFEHLGDRRVLAAITGVVFEDIDHSLRQEPAEMTLPNRLAYIDANENGSLDRGEKVALADQTGQFSFDGLSDGVYQIRLFNGTQSQTQLFPIDVSGQSDAVQIVDGRAIGFASDGTSLIQTDASLDIIDFENSATLSLSIDGFVSKSQRLPDGRFLVVGESTAGQTAWIVDPQGSTVVTIDLVDQATQPTWADVAIDPNGRGVMIEAVPSTSGSQTTTLRSIDASDSPAGIVVSESLLTVPSGTVAMTVSSASSVADSDHEGTRTVLAWAGDDGLRLSLWSNMTKSMITAEPVEVSGTSELLSFDDERGLVLLRELGGGVTVVDVNGFAPLYSFADLTGPVTLDAGRELLFSVLPTESLLRLIDLRSGDPIADLAIDLTSIGAPTAVATNGQPDTVTILGAAGVIEVSIKRPAAHRVTIVNNQDPLPIRFAMQVDEVANQAPDYETLPSLTATEDTTLRASGVLLDGIVDGENDTVVVIQQGDALHGTIEIDIDGNVIYTPDDDFFGTDEATVILTDGMNVAGPYVIDIDVTPVADPPADVTVMIDPVIETLDLGEPIGTIEVIDADGQPQAGGHLISIVGDPRFIVEGGVIVFIGGANGEGLDYETEPQIPLRILVTDSETGTEIIRDVVLTVNDANDPMTEILPHEITVEANVDGGDLGVIAELLVLDQDIEQFHTYSVDDDRFIVDETDLRVKPGVSFGDQDAPEFTINVTATEFDTKETFTQPITIRVNVNIVIEQPQSIELAGNTILEIKQGAEVGTVTVDGTSPAEGVILTVDDSRFEVARQTLKLRDDTIVEWANQSEIELTIRAEDNLGTILLTSAPFVISVLQNRTPYHNRDNPYDVNLVDGVTAADALMIINYLNEFGPGPVGHGDPRFGLDVNADGMITAVDALLVINELNRPKNSGSTVGGEKAGTDAEGEQTPRAKQSDSIAGSDEASADALGPDSLGRDPLGPGSFERLDRAILESTDKAKTNYPISSLARTTSDTGLPNQTNDAAETDAADPLDETLRLLTNTSLS